MSALSERTDDRVDTVVGAWHDVAPRRVGRELGGFATWGAAAVVLYLIAWVAWQLGLEVLLTALVGSALVARLAVRFGSSADQPHPVRRGTASAALEQVEPSVVEPAETFVGWPVNVQVLRNEFARVARHYLWTAQHRHEFVTLIAFEFPLVDQRKSAGRSGEASVIQRAVFRIRDLTDDASPIGIVSSRGVLVLLSGSNPVATARRARRVISAVEIESRSRGTSGTEARSAWCTQSPAGPLSLARMYRRVRRDLGRAAARVATPATPSSPRRTPEELARELRRQIDVALESAALDPTRAWELLSDATRVFAPDDQS